MDPKTAISTAAWAMERNALEKFCMQVVRGDLSEKEDKALGKMYGLAGNTAVIPLRGVVSKYPTWGGTDVNTVRRALDLAVVDSDVKNICLYVDSPGGTVDGISDLSDALHAACKNKHVVAFASGMMASAAYWLGCACDAIVVSQDAIVGSIGVYTVLMDYSKMAENYGIKFELIRTGKYKGADVPVTPISKEQREQAQYLVDSFYTLFVNKVSTYRDMDLAEVQKLADGRVFVGKAAVELGLADGVGTLDSVIAALAMEQEDDDEEEGTMATLGKKGKKVDGGLAGLSSILVGKQDAAESEDDKKKKDADAAEDEEDEEDEPDAAEGEDDEEDEEDEEESKKDKAHARMLRKNVSLGQATPEQLMAARPDLVRQVVAESTYRDKRRRARIGSLIKGAGLPATVAAQLQSSLTDASVKDATSAIQRASSIEAALQLGSMHPGLLNDGDCEALRADVESMGINASISYIRSFVEKKLKAENKQAETVAVPPDAAVTEGSVDAELGAKIKGLRGEYEQVKESYASMSEKDFVLAGLSQAGMDVSEEKLAKACPDLAQPE